MWQLSTGRAPRLYLVVMVLMTSVVAVGVAHAQSPPSNRYMEDSSPSNGWPATANAVVVEGVGSLNCAYSESSIEQATVYWTQATGHPDRVVTEISPQSGCGTLSSYESLLSGIKDYVEAHATQPGSRWAGFMLDEEPDFGFSVSTLETLNNYV